MINNNINFIIIFTLSIVIIFSLTTITSIDTTYANHTKYHLNNSLIDITISGDGISDELLETIKKNIDMEAEQKAFENANVSQLQTTTVENPEKPKIILTNQKYIENEDSDYDDISGQVKNVGNGFADSIRTIFTFYDSFGNMLGTDYTYIDVNRLNTGQKAPFSLMVDKKEIPGMAQYEVALSWYNPDGTEEYIEDVEVTPDPQQKIPIIENTKQATENIPFFKDNNDVEESDENENKEDKEDDEDDEDDDN